jgi:hypothetical protein
MTDTNSGDDTRHWEGKIGGTQDLVLYPTNKEVSEAKKLDFRIFWPLRPGITAKYRGGADYTWTVDSVNLVLVQ